MAHAVPVQILGPFRQEDRLPALGTKIYRPGMVILPGARGSELHDASSAILLLPLPITDHSSAPAAAIKQQR
jgi:hypothetical protein